MELDSRIIEGKRPLTCFDTEQAKEFIGKECYFSDQLCTFNKLLDAYSYVTADILVSKEKYLYVGELLTVGDSDGSCYEAGINGEAEWFQFCLPCEWVKEPKKKYRPYSVMEFIKYYPIGSHLHLRIKDDSMDMHRLIDGYNDYKNGNGTLFMCGTGFSMSELYENYEIFKDGEWKPFGVEE